MSARESRLSRMDEAASEATTASPEYSADLDGARHLIEHGIPVFLAHPILGADGEWDPTAGTNGYRLPNAWQTTKADPSVLDQYKPGMGVAAVMGHGLDGLDVDPRNGGSESIETMRAAGAIPATYGVQETPSGGWHGLVAALGVRSRDGVMPGVDVKAGVDGAGHGFLWLAPTKKISKTTGKVGEYAWTTLPNLDAIEEGGDDSGEQLAGRIEEMRSTKVAPEPTEIPGAAYAALSPVEQSDVDRYLETAVRNERQFLQEAATWEPGKVDDHGRGWEKMVSDVCARFGAFARAPWTPWDDRYAAHQVAAIVPASMSEAVGLRAKWAEQHGRLNPPGFPVFGASLDEMAGGVTVSTETPQDASIASWTPVDLTAYLDGSQATVEPSMMVRTDGVALIYPGLVHSFHGESESGKSLIAQRESVLRINAGEKVLFLDFESDPASIAGRLLEFGATRESIRDRFVYIQPEFSPTALTEINAWQAMFADQYSLCVIDGVTDALAVFGQETKDNDSITQWMRVLPKAIARQTGAGVALIDHVTKDGDSRGRFAIGGQAKMSGLTGAAYTVEVAEALGRGLRGVIVLRVGKDRPGFVRGKSGPMRKSDRTQEAARIVVDSRVGNPVFAIEPFEGGLDENGKAKPWRPTNIMEKIARFLEGETGPIKFTDIKTAVGGRESTITTALEILVSEGYLHETHGPRNARLHQSIATYREADEGAGVTRPIKASKPTVDRLPPYTGGRESVTQPLPESLGSHSESVSHSPLKRPSVECATCDRPLLGSTSGRTICLACIDDQREGATI